MIWWFYVLISCIFVLMLYGCWLRLIAGVMQVNRENQSYHWLIQKTNVLIAPMDNLLGKITVWRVELSCIVVLLVLELLQGYILVGLFYSFWFALYKLPFLVIGDSLIYMLNILFFAMILRVVLGWINSQSTASLREMTRTLTQPFLDYSRELIPITGGFDMAPLVWVVLFKVTAFVIYASLAVFMH